MRIGRKVAVAVVVGSSAIAVGHVFAGTQQCNTACQSRMTDCILACDGKIACELECKQRAVGCVEACSSDAGAAVAPRREMTVDAGVALVEAGDAARPDASRARPPLDAGPRVPGRAEAGAQ